MALYDDLQRQAGQPRRPEFAGAPPLPSQPNTSVAPPGPAAAPVGRPPAPPPMRLGPGAGGGGKPASSAPSRQLAPAPAQQNGLPSPTPAAAMPLMVQMDRMPSRAELATLPSGTSVQTPFGTVTPDGGIAFTPEGAQQYQAAVVQRRKSFGQHPFANDPSAPQPPVEPGRSAFNPFTGTWLGAS